MDKLDDERFLFFGDLLEKGSKLMEEGKDDYMETMITERLGEYYNCIKFINNVNNCDPIQARMPFELVVR